MEAFVYRARGVRVVDGDTMDVEVDLGFKVKMVHRLRLKGVDTPEKRGETMGPALLSQMFVERALHSPGFSKTFLKCQDKGVPLEQINRVKLEADEWSKGNLENNVAPGFMIRTSKSDAFGRWLAEVFIQENEFTWKSLNSELLRLGLAQPYKRRR